jgi:hypothetical protein
MTEHQDQSAKHHMAIFRQGGAIVIIAAVIFALAGYLISYALPGGKVSKSSSLLNGQGGGQKSLVKTQPSAASAELAEAKHMLDDRAAKLEEFKKNYSPAPTPDTVAKAKAALRSQLEASRRAARRASEDRAYTQSLLSQQLSGRTGAKLSAASESSNPAESVEVRQLRFQITQYDDQIASGAKVQKSLQKQLDAQQDRAQSDSEAQQQYKKLTEDYDAAQKTYSILLARSTSADPTSDQAGTPAEAMATEAVDQPSEYPSRHLWFAGAGLGGGLAIGAGVAFWFARRHKTLRTAQDVETTLQAPLLVSVPWIGSRDSPTNGKNPPDGSSADKAKPDKDTKDTIEV